MALSHAKREEIPEDAVIISQEEALTYQWKIISEWEKPTEVIALRNGPAVLSVLSGVTGFFVNNHYRKYLRLGVYGRSSTYLPIVVIPALFTYMTHKYFVQRDLILTPIACPLCLQTRASAFQSGIGCVYPTVLAPFAAFMFATRHYTYRLPSITKNPKDVFKLWRKMTRPITPVLATIFVGQAIAAAYITYREQLEYLRLQIKMQEIENKIMEEHFSSTSSFE
ncbi:uncharacterized protein LOC119681010 [Teleopsis dalmanni]|uniref:uncharacterized protein LOC119681010 n=1 Tax=Teleopsis dalmanni TaxID=139649 RepID=UPI000D32A39F|nr:uncharacterized protein LOC119681010 [Teleopsis dalmanni]